MSFEREIQQWVSLDNELKILNEKARGLREKRSILEKSITTQAQSNNLSNANIKISDGNLRFINTKVTEPLTFRYLEKSLNEVIKNESQVKSIIEYIKKCKFVISDSGGLQEECSYLNKKIIVCRKTTERPESVGIHSIMCETPSKLENIINNVINNYYINAKCMYGDGTSWKKIKKILDFDEK